MATPATFNIAYYRGDTYELNVRPKDQDGNSIDLTAGGFTAAFTIASSRGPSPDTSIACTADIIDEGTVIYCMIPPTQGALLSGSIVYVYDVEVSNGSAVHTYLTGTVTVTEDVSNS